METKRGIYLLLWAAFFGLKVNPDTGEVLGGGNMLTTAIAASNTNRLHTQAHHG